MRLSLAASPWKPFPEFLPVSSEPNICSYGRGRVPEVTEGFLGSEVVVTHAFRAFHGARPGMEALAIVQGPHGCGSGGGLQNERLVEGGPVA